MLKKITFLLPGILFTVATAQMHANEEANYDNALLNALIEEQPVSAPTAPFEAFTGKVKGQKVRMRTDASLESHIVRETRSGELFAVVDSTDEFYAVAAPKDVKGYVFRTFVLDDVVEGDHVNVRLYPDIEAPVIGQLFRGDKIDTSVSDINPKWLEIDAPSTAKFFIAKDYLEKQGPIELLAVLEKKHNEATHHLSSVFLYAQSEIQKPFPQIDLDSINVKFKNLIANYTDLNDIVDRANEAHETLQNIFVQKKIAFLECKALHGSSNCELDPADVERLAKLGIDINPQQIADVTDIADVTEIADAATQTMGLVTPVSDTSISEKMLSWNALEKSLYHLWVVANGEHSLDEFYQEEELNSTLMTGVVEPYNRPVKNLPGDYILKNGNLPTAFLYSTRVNLENLVGKQVTVKLSSRPNNKFAYPAYYVLSVE